MADPFELPATRAVVRAVRRRFHAEQPQFRPALDASSNWSLTRSEAFTLARLGALPLPKKVVAWIQREPSAHRRRPAHRLRALEEAVAQLDELVVALAAAVAGAKVGAS